MPQSKFAVIGSNCFTGSHLVDALLEERTNYVLGLSRSPEKNSLFLPYLERRTNRFQFHQVDLYRESAKLLAYLDDYQPSIIINVAALSEVGLSNFQPVEYFETNTLGVVSLCNGLRTRPYLKRYVQISTAEVYGTCTEPLKENAPINPSTPYAVSKAAADLYLLALYRNFGFPIQLIRSTNVYGEHQQLFKIIPRSIIYLKQGKKIELHGGGRAIKTWVHVRDVVNGIKQAVEMGTPGEIYHFSDMNSMSIESLVRTICELMNYDFGAHTTSSSERMGQDAQYLLDYEKAKRKLNWSPKIKFVDGLRETIRWVEDNWKEMGSQPLEYVHRV